MEKIFIKQSAIISCVLATLWTKPPYTLYFVIYCFFLLLFALRTCQPVQRCEPTKVFTWGKIDPLQLFRHTFPFATFYTDPLLWRFLPSLVRVGDISLLLYSFDEDLFFSWRRLSFRVCRVLDNRGRPLLLTVSFFWETCFILKFFLPFLGNFT